MPSFAEVDAPRSFEGTAQKDLPPNIDWIEYRERYLIDSMARLASMMRERGLERDPAVP